ncbi:tetratricopeptide repeat protein [Streptomyces sp. NPDC057445]|uniref:tetratricopeptide repeat protein n=1 Tax=Streptomyces sp. NPDC057445 TaxID=3346136 RepID=UPI0036CAF42E
MSAQTHAGRTPVRRRRLAAGLAATAAAGAATLPLLAQNASGFLLWGLAGGTALMGGAAAFFARTPAPRTPEQEDGGALLSPPPHNLPVLSRYFTGRSEELAGIEAALGPAEPARGRRTRLDGQRACVIHGMGGVGKSQLAVAHARTHLDEHCLTWWLNASTPDRLRGELLELAACVGVPDHESKNVVLVKLWAWLRDNPGWLLVYDDVRRFRDRERPGARGDGTLDLQPFLPPEGEGEILITTQLREGWDGLCPEPVELTALGDTDGLAFLRARIGARDGDESHLATLGRQLGWLPLALEQAGAYIDQAEITVEDYLGRLPEESADSDADTFRLAIERIAATAPAAEDLLRLCSFLASEDVPRVMLFRHRAVVPQRLRHVMEVQPEFNRLVLKLVDHSLLTRSGDGRAGPVTYGIHPRVQMFIRRRMSGPERLEWSQAAVRLLEAAFPQTPEQLDSRGDCERLMPHVEAVAKELAWADDTDGGLGASHDPEALVRLLHRVGVYQEHRCDWVQALACLTQEAGLRELGTGDALGLATARLGIARQHYLLADLDRAETACRRALALCQEHAGDTAFLQLQAQCRRQYGGILRERIRFDEGLEAVQEAIKIYESQGSGWETLDWAVAEQEAGMIHRNAGRLSAAVACYERAGDRVPSRGSTEPGEHVVFRAMLRRDLGIVAQDRGDLVTAERELREALSVFREYRGVEDFETSQVAKFLADVLRRQGEECRKRARATRHPLRRRDLHRQARSRIAQADELLAPVLALHLKRRETEAHKYAACLNKLGSLRFAQGRIPEAARTLREAEQIYVSAYGPDHHYRAKTLSRLGPVLRAAGDREGAERVLRQAERIFVATLGSSHPSLVAVYTHLAECTTGHERAAELRARAELVHRALWNDSSP